MTRAPESELPRPGLPRAGAAAQHVAFVCQGGGGLTAPQVGMLRALTEAAIVPNLVVGASAGALNAAVFASRPTLDGIDRLGAVWTSLRRRDVLPLSLREMIIGLAGRGEGLASNAALRELLERGFVASRIEETAIPLHVVATDLATGDPVVLSGGDSVAALLATSAFPGVFPPVTVAGRRLIDGGVSAHTPILQAESLGATVTYVLPSAGPAVRAVPRGAVLLALRALNQLLGKATGADLAAARGRVHVLPAPNADVINPFDLRGTRSLIDEGYRLAHDWLHQRQLSAA
jgi:NTE family protein